MQMSRGHIRLLLIAIVALAISSCRGGGPGGALPPIGSRHLQSTAAASVAQWSSGTPWAPASIAVSWPAAPAIGDVLVVAFWNNGQTSGAANTYTPPAGWTLVDQNTSHAYATYQSFTHIVGSGEANAYVFTPLAAQRAHAWIAADVSGTGGVDKSGNSFISNATSYTTPSLAPSQASDLAVAFDMPMTTSALTWSNPAGWTVGTGPTSTWRGEALFQSLTSTAAVSESSTLSGSAYGFSALVLLTPSGTQSTPSPTPSASSSAGPTPTPTPTPAPTPSSGGGGGLAKPSQWTSGAAFAPASVTVSWPSAAKAGDMLVVAFWNNGQADGSANTYAPPVGWSISDQNTSAYATYEVFWHIVAPGETNSYSFVPQAAQRQHAWIGADIGGASSLEGSGNRFVSGTAYTTPTLTPARSGDLAIAFNLPMTLGALTWSNPVGWTVGTGPTSTWRGQALYEALSSTAPISESAALSAAASGWAGLVLVASGGTQPTPTPTPTSRPAIDWSTMGYDAQRTGYNPNETSIGPGSFGTMHPLWTTLPSVGNFMQGEPAVAANVNVGGVNQTMLYAGGGGGMFYGINADTGAVVWSKSLGTTAYVCSGVNSTWGIEGSPALDRARNRVYVPDGQNRIHALDLATGAEASGWPVSAAPVTSHDFIHTAVNYNANNGMLYTTTSSTCDISPWYGRVAAIDTSSGSLVNTFYPAQGNSGGGIWGVGGVSIDPSTNNVFIAVGNTDDTNGASESAFYGEHIVELSADLSTVIAASFPPNMPVMFDSDFGATPLLFQPIGCPPLLAAVNKSGAFVLYDRTNISAGPIQEIVMASTGSEFRDVPSYDPATNYVYVALPDSQGIYLPGIGAFSIAANCTLNTTPVWNGTFGATGDKRSAITIANGVAYVGGYNENAVYAFNAATGAQLWSGSLSGAGQIGPVVVNGRLYVGDAGGTIHAWGP